MQQFSVRFFAQLIVGTLLLTLPLLVLPFTEQFVVHTKLAVMIFGTLTMLGLYAAQSMKSKVLGFTLSPLTIPVLGFGFAILASTFFTGNYPVEHLLGMGGLYLALVLFVLFGGSVFRATKPAVSVVSVLLLANVLLLISSALQLTGFGPAYFLNFFLPNQLPTDSLVFNLTGSSLVSLQVAIVTLVGTFVAIMYREFAPNLLHKIAIGATVFSLVLHGWAVLPGQVSAPLIMPWSANWSVAIDTLRAPRTALIGFGPQSFSNASNIFRPEWLNMTEFWGIQFNQGSNMLLTLIVTTGLFGLLSFLSIFFVLFRQTKSVTTQTKPIHWMLFALLAVLIFFPPNIVIIGLLAVLLATWIASESNRFADVEIHGLSVRSRRGDAQEHIVLTQSTSAVLLLSGILLLLVGATTYGYGRAYAAEVALLNSTKAAVREDVIGVYEYQQQAINLNPYMDIFRRRYSATNIAIAAALAEQENLSEADQQQFSELVQQAIREGRAATALDETDVNNWLSLAQIYRSLIGAAEDAEQWSITSYITAIQLAPTDPGLRIEAGGVLYAGEAYQDSIQLFQEAITLKPDMANGYYNLANALVQIERFDLARNAYQQTLLLLEPDSEDYVKTAQELAAVEAKLEELGVDLDAEPGQQTQTGTETGAAADGTSLTQPGQETGTPSINSQNLIPASQVIQPNQPDSESGFGDSDSSQTQTGEQGEQTGTTQSGDQGDGQSSTSSATTTPAGN